MLLSMRWPVLLVVMALADCGGGTQSYWSDDDAGHCVEHASQQTCHARNGPCDDGGPPDEGNFNATAALVPCTP